MYIPGKIPNDGIKSESLSGFHFRPALKDGQRLTGVVTIPPPRYAPDVEYRLLIDGEPQDSMTIDTTLWSDDTHVVALQIMDAKGQVVRNGSAVAVFNNSGNPVIDTHGVAITADTWGGTNPNSLAWGRVDIAENMPYPLDPQLSLHPIADTEEKRIRLLTDNIWWVEGFTHQPTYLWKTIPMLMKNEQGDCFVKHYNPQGGGAGVTPENAEPYVRCAPKFDGPRGIGNISPYATMNPYFERTLASGQHGLVGVDKSGRVFLADITGEVETILGPRSVSGVVGTDCDILSFDIPQRIAAGEMEYVGDDNGLSLKLPHDIWPCSSFPFEGTVADTGNNRVAEIHFEEQRLMRSWPLDGVTSVWDSKECQMTPGVNIIWFAVNPEGLWCQRHTVAAAGTNTKLSGGPDGTYTGHVATLEKLADIPGAFWVRGFGTRVFVFTKDLGVYEYNAVTGEVTEVLARKANEETYVFAAIDEAGSIGPVNRIYWGSASQKNGGYGSSKTAVFWLDPYTWEQGYINKARIANKSGYTNWTASVDPLGHYMWGIAIHPVLPKFLACGISSSSWFMWTGCLGESLEPDPVLFDFGTKKLFQDGIPDSALALSAVFGIHGHGGIGYSCDQFRDYKTWEEAKPVMMAFLEPFLAEYDDKELVAKQLFAQRTRNHYQVDSSPVEPTEPVPTEPTEPTPEPATTYTITVTDSAGNKTVFVNAQKQNGV